MKIALTTLIKSIFTVILYTIGMFGGVLTIAYEKKPEAVFYGIICVLGFFFGSILLWNIFKSTLLNFEKYEKSTNHSNVHSNINSSTT